MEADFSGWATKVGLKCSDGRTIMPDAFKHMNGVRVPLVWAHGHNSPENILGHVDLEAREDGVYCYGYFNDTPAGKNAKALVEHKDIDKLSIYANQLVEKAKQVFHGMIREVSLVLAGANPGALIDFIAIQHGDGDIQQLDDEAIIYTGLKLELKHADNNAQASGADEGPTVQEVYDSMSQEQKDVLHYMVGAALEGNDQGNMAQSATNPVEPPVETNATEGTGETTTEGDLTHQEGTTIVTHNVFETAGGKSTAAGEQYVLTHDAIKGIFESAQKSGSMKAALEEYVLAHGIDNIEVLFPDAKAVTEKPEFDKRRTEWVASVLNGTHKTPFSKIKTLSADLTLDAARAKGYVKGSMKKEEFFAVAKRTTGPTTFYKKQKLDRDDIIDITDFDVVAWLWAEIRLMLEEELARAILIGDGREVDDEDKIKDPAAASSGDGIRSILHDHDYYAMTINLNLGDANSSYREFVDTVIKTRRFYKGTGLPTMYTTEIVIGELLTLRDDMGRRYYRTLDELATELRVAAIVPVEVMETETDLLCILVNLSDYNIGATKGGEITQFDDFDIDYNQYKYLMEARLSGALTKLKSALIYKTVAGSDALVVPNSPTFVSSTGVVTIVATTGVVYKDKDTGATLSTGAQAALDPGASITVVATPAAGYYLADNINDEWTFTRDAA